MMPLLVAIAVLLPSTARSQEQPGPNPGIGVGNKIRLWAPTVASGHIDGTVLGMDRASVTVGKEGRAPISVSREAITALDVRVGQKRHWRKGAIIGAATIATMVGGLCAGAPSGYECHRSDAPLMLGMVAEGAVLGAGVGAVFKTDRWRSVPVDRVRFGLAPTAGRGMRFSLALKF
jgi:hypothetical protein